MNYLKTAILLVALTALLMGIGHLLGGANGVIIAFVISLLMNGISYWYSDKIVLKMYRARELTRQDHPDIFNTVEVLSSRAGIPCPKIYIADMDVPNAFATGRDPEHGALCLTSGVMRLLDEDELEGVISHELTHIKNRDTLIMTLTAALASAVMMIAYMARWAAILGGIDRDSRDSGGGIVGLLAVSIMAPLAAMLIQMAISRSREYAADAGGARITGRPEGLARALEDLSRYSKGVKVDVPAQTQHMFIIPFSLRGFMGNLFSTHPPTEERVKRLRGMVNG